jgi:hypothetical protein
LPNNGFQNVTPSHSGSSQPQYNTPNNPSQTPLKDQNVTDNSQAQSEAKCYDVTDQNRVLEQKPDFIDKKPPLQEINNSSQWEIEL